MFMPSGTCSTPVAADVYGGSCYSYCASTSSDCSVCPSDTYYEGYGTNTACDACDGSMVIADDGTDASAHDGAGDCVGSPTAVPIPVPTKVSSIGCDKCAILVPSSNKNLSLHHFS